jgi:protein-tyrosine sulfotransferase
MNPPIFILGVPRSGTTLVRTILDSHPAIACGPETPWLGGHHPRTAMRLHEFLVTHEHGYCANFHQPRDVATRAVRLMVDELLTTYARSRGKPRWAEKTPDNALYVPFLTELFPEAKLILVSREGLDVACSTSIVAEHRRGVSKWHEGNLGFAPDAGVRNTPLAALLRWRHWSRILSDALQSRPHFRLPYESLVTEPEPVLRQLCTFLDEPFDAAMLAFAQKEHDFPGWEWGSADVQARPQITRDRIGRAHRDLTPPQLDILSTLIAPREAPLTPTPDHIDTLRQWIAALAEPLGLGTPADHDWPRLTAAWLGHWTHALHTHTCTFVGSAISVWPWLAALAGARVQLAATSDADHPRIPRLLDLLRLHDRMTITPAPQHAPTNELRPAV